ncbi:uncharacterized protein LOC131692343 [Topomyia yanbarensis]|uniref:uncharacterized protein LOC131692343 n=1 Tax=Topomyia yanbarensis TaxID=2498891 RepID=UPI00273C8C25|nr:uncharacterized protein LOC131692343 [Topomyia yanbarensis]XP_058835312.1 uncharacterized protein LOC131692343 [Topomyia yanbarensis]
MEEVTMNELKIVLDVQRIILACKRNDIKFLQHLERSDTLQHCEPTEIDEESHNAFYYAIRSGNVELLKTLIDKWPSHDFSKPDRAQLLDNLLSDAYEELKLKNMSLGGKIEEFVEERLIHLRFYSEKFGNDSDNDDINDRINMVIEDLDRLNQEYSPKNVEVDDKFLFLCRIMAQNLHVLKGRLKSTYNVLPWEEMEFCLCAFVSSHTKQQEINFFYNAVLDKTRLLKHTKIFLRVIENMRPLTGHAKCISKTGRKRVENIKDILDINQDFEGLYSDYAQIKDMYSLDRIKYYVELALTDVENDNLHCLAAERALHVMGEYLKNTPLSPHLSEIVSDMLLVSFHRHQRKTMIELRDHLSHAIVDNNYIYEKRAEARRLKLNFREGLKQLANVIQDVMLDRKQQMLIMAHKQLTNNQQSVSKQAKLVRILKNADLEYFDLQRYSSKIDTLTEDFISSVHFYVPDLTHYEKGLVVKIQETLELARKSVSNTPTRYVSSLKCLMKRFNSFPVLHVKDLVTKIGIYAKLFDSGDLYVDIDKLVWSIESKLSLSARNEIFEIYEKLFNIAKLKNNKIDCIEKYRYSLKPKTNRTCLDDTINSLFDQIKETACFGDKEKLQFTKHIEKLKCDCEKRADNRSTYGEFLKKAQKYLDLADLKSFYESVTKLFSKMKEPIPKKIERVVNDIRKEKELKYTQHFHERLEMLQNLVSTNCTHTEKIRNSALETLLLDIFAYLEEKLTLLDAGARSTASCLDKNVPILTGKQMRNFLAHGNALPRIVSSNPLIAVICNVREILQNKSTLLESCDCKKIAQPNSSFKEWKQSVRNKVESITNQQQMFAAAEENIIENVLKYIQIGADKSAKDFNHCNILHYAARGDSINIFEYFHNKDLLEFKNHEGNQPIHIAAECGSLKVIEFFMRETTAGKYNLINAKQKNDFTPLHFAARKGHIEVVNALLTKGAKVDAIDNESWTPLHFAAVNGHTEVVGTLLSIGVPIDATTNGGFTSLHIAAENGVTEVVNTLLTEGAKVDATQIDSWTPLHIAALNGHTAVVQTLLVKGAKVDVIEIDSWTPLHFAAQNGHTEVVNILLTYCASIDATTNKGSMPLHIATQNGHTETVHILLSKGVKVDATDTDRVTPLHFAANNGHTEIVKILLANCAPINATTNEGSTPLHFAARNGCIEVVNTLMTKGAKVDATDAENVTPLHFAANNGHTEIVNILLTKGAQVDAIIDKGFSTLHIAAQNGHTKVVQTLLTNGATIHATTAKGFSILHIAAENGHTEMVNILLAKGAKVDATDIGSVTPLHIAAQNGHPEVVNILLTNCASIDATTIEGFTALHFAAKNGHTEVVNTLLTKGAKVDATTDKGFSTLHIAAENGHTEMVGILLNKGAKVNATDIDSVTPLHFAAQNGHTEVVNILLINCASIDATTANEGTAPLHIAVKTGHTEVVHTLLTNGAKVDATNIDSATPLHFAANYGYIEVVNILLTKGAKVDATDIANVTPLHIAAQKGQTEVVYTLLTKGAKVDATNKDNVTPLHFAAQNGHTEVVNILLTYCASIDATTNMGSMPLHIAAQNGHTEVVNILLRKSAKVDATDIDSVTPLHYAAQNGHTEIVNMLLTNGAKVDATDIDNWTPLHIATQNGHSEVVNILLTNGACIDATTNDGSTPLNLAAQNGHTELVNILLTKYT